LQLNEVLARRKKKAKALRTPTGYVEQHWAEPWQAPSNRCYRAMSRHPRPFFSLANGLYPALHDRRLLAGIWSLVGDRPINPSCH